MNNTNLFPSRHGFKDNTYICMKIRKKVLLVIDENMRLCLFITETNYIQNKIPVENINISFENNKFFLSFDVVKKKLTWQIFLWLVWNSQRELFNKNEWLGCPWKAARISNLRGKILKFLYLEVKFVKTKLQMKSNLLYLTDFLKNWKILNWFYINNILKWSLTIRLNSLIARH